MTDESGAKTGPAEYLRDYADFWAPLVETPDGALDRDKVARELCDYHRMMDEVVKVYDHITRGRLTKPNTLAACVISEADGVAQEDIDEAVNEALEGHR